VGEKKLGKNCRKLYTVGKQVQPECMTRITADNVVEAVRAYLRGDPVEQEELPEYLRRPAVAFQGPPKTPEEKQEVKSYHMPHRVYGPKRREHMIVQPVRSIGSVRQEKMRRWRGSILRPPSR